MTSLKDLPPCMQDSIIRSIQGKQTYRDDIMMGSVYAANTNPKCHRRTIVPFCKQDQYKNTPWCACVNSKQPFAKCVDPACINGEGYRTTEMRDGKCPNKLTLCQNITDIDGTENVAAMKQNLQCGGVVNNISSTLHFPFGFNYPTLARFIVVLLVVIFVALYLTIVTKVVGLR